MTYRPRYYHPGDPAAPDPSEAPNGRCDRHGAPLDEDGECPACDAVIDRLEYPDLYEPDEGDWR